MCFAFCRSERLGFGTAHSHPYMFLLVELLMAVEEFWPSVPEYKIQIATKMQTGWWERGQ